MTSTQKRKCGFISTVVDLSDDEDVSKPSPAQQLVIPHSDYSTSRKDPKRRLIHHSLLNDETSAIFTPVTSHPKIPKSNTLPALDRFLSLSDALDSEIPLGVDDTDRDMVRRHMDDSDTDEDESDGEEPDTGKEKRKRNARGASS
ncbi:hypothetical protein VKT23_006341 [Stygiomarasmius scandens]|uniref:Uncharacterized protein n=1 Tax=Marasmiellus scandens TaxID=2682957 RepID=A0ABR1JRV8_9AGAR